MIPFNTGFFVVAAALILFGSIVVLVMNKYINREKEVRLKRFWVQLKRFLQTGTV